MSVLDLLTYYDFLLSYNVYALCQTFGGFRGIRLGTPAITTRGAKEDLMVIIAELIEKVLDSFRPKEAEE